MCRIIIHIHFNLIRFTKYISDKCALTLSLAACLVISKLLDECVVNLFSTKTKLKNLVLLFIVICVILSCARTNVCAHTYQNMLYGYPQEGYRLV